MSKTERKFHKMRKILIASHGKMAEGIVHSVSIFAGDQQEVQFICAYVDNTPLEKTIAEYFEKQKPETEIIVFTDLLGGSVNRAFLPYMKREHTHVIAGVHLAVVLEFILKPDDYLTSKEVEEVLENSKQSIAYMNTYKIEKDLEDDL